MAKKKKATKKKVKKLSDGGTKSKKTTPSKADKFLKRKLNKDPFKGKDKTYLA